MTSNILNYTGDIRETSGFTRKYTSYIHNSSVIHLDEEREWRKIESEMIAEEKDSIAKTVTLILKARKEREQNTAKILPFQEIA